MTAVSDSLAAAHKMKSIEGVQVVRVVPNSTAASLKVQPGDVLLNVNKAPVTGVPDVLEHAKKFKSGDAVTLRLSRNGRIIICKGEI